MNLDQYISIAHPGPSPSPFYQGLAESCWSMFGDHVRTGVAEKLAEHPWRHTVDPRTGKDAGRLLNLASAIFLHAKAPISHPDAYNKQHWKTVCLDFDGVLNESSGPYHKSHFGQPIPEGMKLLQLLISRNYKVVILTARKETDAVAMWLSRQGFPNMVVTNHKVSASLYVDDRAFSWDSKRSKVEDIMKYLDDSDAVLRTRTR